MEIPEKKIIVDEDWKGKVEAERESLREQVDALQTGEPRAETPMPPPNLTFLASSLYLQGAIALGLLPHPVSGKSEVHFVQARHAIDTLQVLQEKTEGNRTPEETDEIETMLHQLRLGFVEVKRRAPTEQSGHEKPSAG
jgi:hypothetical protein